MNRPCCCSENFSCALSFGKYHDQLMATAAATIHFPGNPDAPVRNIKIDSKVLALSPWMRPEQLKNAVLALIDGAVLDLTRTLESLGVEKME